MTKRETLLCEVCEKRACGVYSALGPVSVALCLECLEANRVPYWNLVGYLFAIDFNTLEDFDESIHNTITATLAFYGKSFEEFKAECKSEFAEFLNDQKELDNE